MDEHARCERTFRVELLVVKHELLMAQLGEAVMRCEHLRLQLEETKFALHLLLQTTGKKIK